MTKTILFIAPAFYSHVQKIFLLARELYHRKYNVILSIPSSIKNKFENISFLNIHTIDTDSISLTKDELKTIFQRVSNKSTHFYGIASQQVVFSNVCQKIYLPLNILFYQTLLQDILNEKIQRPSLIVSDAVCPAGCYLAQTLNVPAITFHNVLSDYDHQSIPYHFPLSRSGESPSSLSFLGKIITWMYRFISHNIYPLDPIPRLCHELGKQLNLLQIDLSNQRSVVPVYMGFEYPRDHHLLYRYVGPIIDKEIDDSQKVIHKELNDWIEMPGNRERPIIFVSFGTVIQLENDQFTSIYNALEQLIRLNNCRILWSLPQSQQELLPKNFMMRSPHEWRFEPFVNQLAVLKSHSIKVFISHGGASSTMESVHCCKPIVCCPFFGDQPDIAIRIQDSKIGQRCQLTTSSLVNAVQEVLVNYNLYYQNMQHHKQLATAAGGIDAAADWCEAAIIDDKNI